MPAYVGEVQVNSLSLASVFELGDAFQLCPYSYIEAYGGAQSFHLRPNKAIISHYSTAIYDQADKEPKR